MSMQYCHNCSSLIDTDFNAEHFDICGVKKSSKAQQGLIWGLLNKELVWGREYSDNLVLKMYGVSQPEKLDKTKASKFITYLKRQVECSAE